MDWIKRLVIVSITLPAALSPGAEKPFQAGSAGEYAHQQSESVTVGAKAFDNEYLVARAFGKKIDFSRYGVVPVLVVVENKRDKALDLRRLEFGLVASDGRHVGAVPPEELPSLATAGKHPRTTGVPLPPVPLPKRKNPLAANEVSVRAFSVQMLAPGDSASGFLYFEAKLEPGDKLYLNGMRDARSGQELLYFEFPLAKENQP